MRAAWHAGVGLFILLLAACGGRLPNTAVPESEAERYFGTPNAATPIVALMREHGIEPLDPMSRVPLLDQALEALRRSDAGGRFAGVTYSLTRTNALDPGWLVQTPENWGRAATDLPFYPLTCQGEDCDADMALPRCRSDADCGAGGRCRTLASLAGAPARDRRVCVGHSDLLTDRIYSLVARARRTVDISLLQPPPDGRFLAALRNAVTTLARSGRRVQVRILVGHYPLTGVDPRVLLTEISRDLATAPSSAVTLQVAAMRSCAGNAGCDSYSWNHSKIVTVDRQAALVGGHNMWSKDYLIDHPVHDLSIQVRGPAAADAAHFLDALWDFVCGPADKAGSNIVVNLPAGAAAIGTGCLPSHAAPHAVPAGSVPILAVGRLGSGITQAFANQGDLARDLLLGAARRSIRIVNQDIAFTLGRVDPLYPESTLERLADFLLNDRGDLHIVLSSPDSVGDSGSSYGNGVSLETVGRKLRQVARDRSSMPDAALDALLCRRLHLALFRFGPDASWPDRKHFANHAKFWMVDERLFYVGSDNLYPVDLQEFGYIVDSRAAAARLLHDYWTPLWTWSRQSAISGDDAPRCVFLPDGR
jgi:phosphatidylserine/phosphatidylglycerophosphate/cardiolipin synthase-like enzyme